ncbi:MAG: RNA methyltransferase [Bacteroidota bacterium]|nr:RNA methyltransferase [Bacteroidota bacterium]
MILSIEHIETLNNPEIEPYKSLRRPIEHLELGIFVAEGEKVVTRLLKSVLTIQSILLSQDWFDIYQPLIEKNPRPIKVFIGKKKLLETIVGHSLHQSMMALAKVPSPITVEELLLKSDANSKKLYVLVDGIANAENMGVIVRNCVCFGVDALIVMPTSCDPYLRRSVRNSMGNIFQLPIVYLSNLKDDRHLKGDGHLSEIEKLKQNRIKLYAAHPNPKSVNISEMKFSLQSCIVLGAEGPGVSQELLDLCDVFVSIPMKEGVDSLNVASASAVMLWEFQKKIMPCLSFRAYTK